MSKIQLKILLYVLFICWPVMLFAQKNNKYEKEEILVINQLLYRVIEANTMRANNKIDSSLLLYFHTGLTCNLAEEYQRDNGRGKLWRQLKNCNLKRRFIDSTKIKRIDKIEIIFGRRNMYTVEKYNSDRVIGTIHFSRINFNKLLSKGYLYYQVYCGEDCGWGEFLKIRKKNGIWIVDQYLSSWVS